MGAGNKLDPTRFEVSDISKTTVCPLARAVRIALRKRGINHLKVVYSKEPPAITEPTAECGCGSEIAFFPALLLMMSTAIIIKRKEK